MLPLRAFLEVAEDLSAGSREADWRSAVSRAYYAGFHTARWLFERLGFEVPRGDSAHAYLWMRLANSGHPDVQNAGDQLNPLRNARNRADYDTDRPLPQPIAFNWVLIAAQFIDLLESVPTVPTVQQQITDAIKQYERDVLRQITWRP
jgi:uncharacterized protein (UPF0332 family)